MRILVTGGAGFLGSHICDRLIDEGHTVVCFDTFVASTNYLFKHSNLMSIANNPNFGIINGDIRNKEQLEVCFKWEPLDAVIHLAAQTGVRPSVQDPMLYYKTNVLGTVNILQLCAAYGIKNLVFASSSSIYGNNPIVPFREDMKADKQLSPYAATKKAGENACYVFHKLYGINVVCLRPFTVYGPRQRKEMAISSFTRKIHAGEEITLFGDATNSRDYTYVSDAVKGFISALYCNKGYEIYNIGGSNPISLSSLVEIIEQALGKKACITHDTMQLGEAYHTYADISKAKAKLGYSAIVSIEDGIKKYIDWYLGDIKYAV